MKPTIKAVILVSLLMTTSGSFAQQEGKTWTLRNCIDYALQNNIQIKKMQVAVKDNEASYEQSKASRYPSLSAGAGENFTHQKALSGDLNGSESSWSGNYSLRSDVTLFNGFKTTNTIALDELNVKSAGLDVNQQQNTIELAVTSAYLNVLYARESVINAENTLSASEAQKERAKVLYDGGYIAESNYAQVEAQYSSDSYSLVKAKNSLNQQVLSLKQLLELDINQDLNLQFPDLKDDEILVSIPDKQTVYNTALSFMPEIENGRLAIEAAQLNINIAKAGKLPTLSLSASASTGYENSVSGGFGTQLGDNFYQNAGLSLSIPIYSNRQVKTSISKAELGLQTARLSLAESQKDLLSRVESAYLDAVSARSRFLSATEQLKSTEKSYTLIQDQFNLGMKNTVDLLTEKNNYLSAQQEYLQSKYDALLSYKILDFYQQKKIEL